MEIPNLKTAAKRSREAVIETKNYLKPTELVGENKKCYVRTYGCQMNEHDSENIRAILEEMGYKNTDNYLDADLIILNTCAIRENAHN